MNYLSLLLAALGGTVASFGFGFLVFWLAPGLTKEFRKYPAVYRPEKEMMKVMPIGFAASFVSILVAAVLFAMIHQAGVGEGAIFGALVGLFAVCAFVLHNYVNLRIGLKLTQGQALLYFIQWTITGMVIGLIYKPF